MRKAWFWIFGGVMLGLGITACGDKGAPAAQPAPAAPAATPSPAVAQVDAKRLRNANTEPGEWMSHGRTYDEQRYSPLAQINAGNVDKLGLAWQYKLDIDRGTEATALVVDGVMYTTGALSIVYALDAVSGELLWKFDPEVPPEMGGRGCCGVVNRGVAVWEGRVYVGAYDGRLIALDAATGQPVWSVNTVDSTRNYTVTGAPRIIDGKVIIGNGGAELGVRGYVGAYDAKTGDLLWRFYTVPGDPAQPPEDKAMELARKTWFGEQYHEQGGGGTVWDSMAYDPELDLLYIGTGNGSPWNIKYRSEGRGDNLFLSSIVALRPATGEYVWHYQTTPGDSWDYTATQHIVLADLTLEGKPRKVLMQAPKNGFFYVLDRATGELLSAEKFANINWATHVDLETGRPVLTETADYSKEPKLISPSPFGAHNWQPMSFHPGTGLVYIPHQESIFLYEDLGQRPQMALNAWNVGLAPFKMPETPEELAGFGQTTSGSLLAWDPVRQEARWSVPYDAPWNGGTLSTAGGLVFQGSADAHLNAYAAETGERLWRTPANTGVIAAPMTYEVEGQQYLTVMAGWGGTFALAVAGAFEPQLKVHAESRILTYKLGGTATLPAAQKVAVSVPKPPPVAVGEEQVEIGRQLYSGYCAGCHGVSAVGNGLVADLRYMSPATHEQFTAIVSGAATQRGMPAFGHLLPPEYIELIHQFLNKRAADLYRRVNEAEAPD